MDNNFNGVGGSFTIDSATGLVALTKVVADQDKIAYSPINDTPKGESDDDATN